MSDDTEQGHDASSLATAPGIAEPTDDDLAGFFDFPTELFGVFDPKLATAWVSPAVAGVLGYRPQELEHVDLGALVHPDDLGSPTTDVEDFPRNGGPLTLEVRCRSRDGSWRWLEWSGSWDDAQALLFGAARDVTDRHVAREAARAHERLIQAILDHSTSAIYVKGLDGRFVLVNEAFARAFGVASVATAGRTGSEVPGFSGDGAYEVERVVLQSGRSVVRDEVVETVRGPRTMITVRFPLRDGAGAVVGLAAIATDVSDRTEAERELARRERVLDTIMRSCPDIVALLDRQGRLREVSNAAAHILGYPLEHPVLHDPEALVHPDDRDGVRSAYRQLLDLEQGTLAQGQLDLRYRVRHRDGHWVTLDSRGQSLVGDDGESAGAVIVCRDVTAHLAFEAELEAAVSGAEQASTAKSEFLSRMSHELRTPLNSVLGFAQLLELDELDEQKHMAVGHIVRAGRHLLGLIDEVLDIARIESGRLDLNTDSIRVGDVLMDAVDLARPLAEDRAIGIEIDLGGEPADPYVLGDRQRLLQVLLNLLSNGIKYNHAGGRVWVEVRVSGDRTEVAVRDSGPGIDEADAHRVFAPFDRLGAERSGIEGTGVGLPLSKHLVEEMGGTLGLLSTPGEGAVFTVSLPSAPPPGDWVRPPSRFRPGARAGSGIRVLHIEDNIANLELVEQVLARAGDVELSAAMSGSLGLALAAEHRPDLVLLDLNLPDMPGTEVLQRLRDDPATVDVPVVVVSADATPTAVRELRASGVVAYLAKPIDVLELLRLVELVATERGS